MDLIDFGRYVGALFVTLGLMVLAFWAFRRFGPRLGLDRAGAGAVGPRRVEVVESRMLDARRRLVVARFAGREHLLLLGQQNDVVVASAEAAPEPAAAGDDA
jgi:flagellar biogenesis protein FliO